MSLNNTALPATRALRIGVVHKGRVVHEQVFSESERIRIGSDRNADIVLAPGTVPRCRTLFNKQGDAWQLCLQAQDQGRLSKGPIRDLAQCIAAGKTQVSLDCSGKGKISLGQVTVLFQLIPAPAGRLQAGAFRPRLVEEDDPVFLGSLALISSAAAVLMIWVVQQEPLVRLTIEEVPPHIAEMIFVQPAPKPVPELGVLRDPEAPATAVKRVETLVVEQPDLGIGSSPRSAGERKVLAQQTVHNALDVFGLGNQGESRFQTLISDRGSEVEDLFAEKIANSIGQVQTATMGPSIRRGSNSELTIGSVVLEQTETHASQVATNPVVDVMGRAPNTEELVTGDNQALEKLLRRQLGPAVKTCYEQVLNSNPSAEGRIEVRLELFDGEVMELTMVYNEIAPQMGTCLSRAANRWSFGLAEGSVVMPYVLSHSE